jgi:hypothetical protein
MKLNPKHPGTYAGQPARIIVAAEMSSGRLLFALRTIGGTVATCFDTARPLRDFAAQRFMVLEDEQN